MTVIMSFSQQTVRWPLMYALIVCCTSSHLTIALSIVQHLILAIFVANGEWVNLTSTLMLAPCFYEHPYCTHSDIYIYCFSFFRTNVLI